MQETDHSRVKRRPPLCASAPLLWGLLPLVLGILSARFAPLPAVICGFILAVFPGRRATRREWILILCFACGFLNQWSRNEAPHPLWRELPPREAALTVEITELFSSRKPQRISGIGKIIRSDIPFDTVTGKKISFYLKHEDSAIKALPGQRIRCVGALTYIPHIENMDSFQSYLISRDVFMTINNGTMLEIISEADALVRVRRHNFDYFKSVLTTHSRRPQSPGNVLASMLLGDRSLLTDDRIELYRTSGTYHLFAVSGLHVGCIALFSAGIFRVMGMSMRFIVAPQLLTVWYYVWLTGASPSSVRAGIMISCIVTARVLLRQPHLFPALIASAWIVLLWIPQQLFNLGFQLSYAVVGSIILIGLPISSFIGNSMRSADAKIPRQSGFQRAYRRLLSAAVDIACISVSAGIVSMPLIVEHFNLFTPGGIVAGILLNPLASVVILIGCLAMFMAPVFPVIAGWITIASWPLIGLIEAILQFCLRVPGAYSNRTWILPHAGILVVSLTLLTAWLVQRLRQYNNRIPAMLSCLPVIIAAAGLTFGSVDA